MPDFLVGDNRIRPDTGEVLRAGETIHLEPRSMAVLVALIERAGEVVSREALFDAVWQDVHVGDDSLTAAIIKIRRALGDNARDPRHVETIPKRGYRLIAPVRPVPAPGEAPPRRPRAGRRARLGGLVAAAMLVVALTLFGALWPRPARDPGDGTGAQADAVPVVAIAPFVNGSHDPAQDYLAAGIRETLLTDLAQMRTVSVRRLDETRTPPGDDVYRLEGYVLHEGDAIRVDARLVDARSGTVLSALRFDRPFSDLLTIEDEIRDMMLTRLEGSIAAAEKSRRARGYTDNIAAYDLYLRGQRNLLIRTRDTNLAARELFRQAIAADPGFARAYGGLALTHAAEARNGWSADREGALEQAMTYARTAVGISPDLPEQHWVIGYVLTQKRRYGEARAELQAAIALDPGYADAYALLGGIETYREHPAATVPLLRQAMRRNPGSGHLYFLLLARAYYFLGDYAQAEINLREALSRNPENLEAHLYLAATLHNLERDDDGAWEAMEVLGSESDFSLERWSAAYPMARGAQLSRLLADLRAVGLP